MKSFQDGDPAHLGNTLPGFLLGGGTVATLLQTLDWSDSPLGPPDSWGACLRTLMATLLPAQAQIILFWGEHYAALYNDAYAPTIGAKHPRALGRPAQEQWSELWGDLEPLLRRVRETGETFSAKDRPFYIERRGLGETAYFDVSYSAVQGDEGEVGGILCIVTETTERVHYEQRQTFLLELGRALPEVTEPEEIEAFALRRIGEQLGASRVFFAEMTSDGAACVIARDWVNGVASQVGDPPLPGSDDSLLARLRKGQSVQGDYAAGESHDRCASMKVPVLRGGALEAVLCVHFNRPHVFTDDECQLLEEAAKRTWEAMIHARAERALRVSAADLQSTLAELLELNASLEDRVADMLAEREAALLQLHETSRMETVGQLTGGIAHDFNNMLTPIIASLELIARRPEDTQRSARLIDGALQAAERARNLVGRLLSFGRRQTLKPQPVGLATLVRDMRELITRSLGPDIDLVIDIDPALPAVVVDPHQLELALLNLVANARDAMEQGGNLKIVAGMDDKPSMRPAGLQQVRLIWLRVSDSGLGMTDEVLSHCAEPFYSTKSANKGAGLGLPMVQGLAVQSGGGLTLRSSPGAGTDATLWLPVSEVEAARRDDREAEVPMAQRPFRVLLVDDEEIVRHATALQMSDLGYEVLEAASAAEAMSLVQQGCALDALVTDHVMPEVTGAEFATRLRQGMPELPVLIITGYANLSPRELNGFEVLRKPFRRAELAHGLARLVAGRA